jgi:Arc/MetJ family transcription regulator
LLAGAQARRAARAEARARRAAEQAVAYERRLEQLASRKDETWQQAEKLTMFSKAHAPGTGHDQGHVHEVSLVSEIGVQDIQITSGGTRMAMVKTPVEIDQEALALAAEVLGTKTKKDTVNAALREVGQRLDRLRALARLREMADQGDFDEFVGNKAAYRR